MRDAVSGSGAGGGPGAAVRGLVGSSDVGPAGSASATAGAQAWAEAPAVQMAAVQMAAVRSGNDPVMGGRARQVSEEPKQPTYLPTRLTLPLLSALLQGAWVERCWHRRAMAAQVVVARPCGRWGPASSSKAVAATCPGFHISKVYVSLQHGSRANFTAQQSCSILQAVTASAVPRSARVLGFRALLSHRARAF
jgi:hypothetical protein